MPGLRYNNLHDVHGNIYGAGLGDEDYGSDDDY